jgi:hypothetical protein
VAPRSRAGRRSASIKPRALIDVATASWTQLNDFLRTATEVEAKALVDAERAGRFRPLVLHRIVCRYVRMHSERLRRELITPPKS